MALESASKSEQKIPAKPEPKPDPNDSLPRRLGRYLLLRRIARGGMGEVFLAATTGVEGAERPVVVKVIRRDHVADPSFLARFLDEARVQSQLQHSGIALVLEAALDPETGEPFAAVEHVEGKSLGDLRGRAVQIGRQIGWADAVALATLVAEALAHVHERQDASGRPLAIVHRDLSPQNVMVSYAGDVKIIDFGTARGLNRRCHTVAGVVFAKPGYVAPEVANGDSGDAKVDVYALGVMLWELCAGRRFLQGDANVHMAAVARNGKSLPPLAAVVGSPIELDAILATLTAFDKAERPSSRAAAHALAKVLANAPPLANGERSIRARTAELMVGLFPGEPQASRREFQKLVAAARDVEATPREVVDIDMSPAEPAVGEVLAGTRWRLEREIGRGASSIVYEAEHLDLGRRAAVKVLGAEASRATDFAARFRREARALSRLSHPSLIGVFDVGVTTDGRLFCVMELLDGETLEAFLAREKGVDYREALTLADKVLAALEIAHGANVVHRDIKPANLFLGEPFGVKVLDFGLAKTEGEGAANERKSEFSIFGTPEYMAPEQAASGRVDARADIYALGCVLYETLTGKLPFAGGSAVAILEAKMVGSPERPRDRAPTRGIPFAVDELVMRAIARHPNMRFQTAAEMRRAIDLALGKKSKGHAKRTLAFAVIGAAVMASSFAMAGGRLGSLRGLSFLAHTAAPAALAQPIDPADGALAFDPSAGVVDPNDSWARAERGEDAEVEAAPVDEPSMGPVDAASEPTVKGPTRAHPRKRKGDLSKLAAKTPTKTTAKPVTEPSIDDAQPTDDEKTARAKTGHRPKKKSRLAHVDDQ